MKKILIYGDNLISNFLISALSVLNYDVIDITQNESVDDFYKEKSIEAIIDVSNSVEMIDEESVLYHNNEGILDLLQLCVSQNIPLLFIYKEPANLSYDSALNYALDNIKKFIKRGTMLSTVQIDDIYGLDIMTSSKITEYLHAVSNFEKITLEKPTSEYFLMHQRDLVSGIIAIIKELKLLAKSKNYTLLPESPISDLELGELISDLSDSELDVEFSLDLDRDTPKIDIDTHYPVNWFPSFDTANGFKELFTTLGITKASQQKQKIGMTSHDKTGAIEDLDISQTNQGYEPDANQQEFDRSEGLFETSGPIDTTNDVDLNNPLDESELTTTIDQLPTQLEPGAKYYRPTSKLADTISDSIKKTAKHITAKAKKSNKVNQKIALVASVAIFIAVLALPLNYVNNYKKTIDNLNRALISFNTLDYKNAIDLSNKAINESKKLYPIPFYVAWYNTITQKDPQNQKNGIDQITYISELVYEISNLKSLTTTDDGSVLGVTNIKSSPTLKLDRIAELTSLIKSNTNTNFLVNKIDDAKTANVIKSADNLYKIKTANLYQILGFESQQNYLIVTADATKLTRNGGRILNLIEYQVKNAEIIKTHVFDTSLISNQAQLNGFTPKADEISKEFLATQNLPFEYSNNYPEFKNFALYITELIKKFEKRQDIDGVIQITSDKYADVFGRNGDNINIDELINNLNDGGVIIWNRNPQILAGVYQNGWGGSIPKYKNDILGFYELALGENGNSKTINRLVEHQLSITQNNPIITKTSQTTYHNQGQETYTAIVGIIVPRNTTIAEIIQISNDQQTNITRSVDYKNVGFYDEISTIIEILPNEQKTLVFKYETQINGLKKDLNLLIHPQLGSQLNNAKILVKYDIPPQANIQKPLIPQGYVFIDQPVTSLVSLEIPL